MQRLLLSFILVSCTINLTKSTEEECARNYVKHANDKLTHLTYRKEAAHWNFSICTTDENREISANEHLNWIKCLKETRNDLLRFKWQNFQDPDLVRQIMILTKTSDHILPLDKHLELQSAINKMLQIHSLVKVPDYQQNTKKNLTKTELVFIFQQIRNPAELKYLWTYYNDEIGQKILPIFERYVELKQEAARLSGSPDSYLYGEDDFDEPNLLNIVDDVIKEVQPLYVQIHAFTRFCLQNIYGALIRPDGPIPLHIIGDLFGSNFQWLVQNFRPFVDRKPMSYTILKEAVCDRRKIYELADDFFVSIGFPPMPPSVWANSLFEKPAGSEVIMHVITFQTKIPKVCDCESPGDLTSLPSALWAVSCIKTQLLQENLPYPFKHLLKLFTYMLETVSILSIGTLKYLSAIQRFNYTLIEEDFMNEIFDSAMEHMPEMIHSYVYHKWKFKVFKREIPRGKYNCEYWKLFHLSMGIESPTARSNKDFDVGSVLKIVNDDSFLAKIIGRVMGFQLFKGLCIKAGEYDPADLSKPLYKCSLYGYKFLGEYLIKSLTLGKSKQVNYVLEVVTGSGDLNSEALLEYYRPLMEWLVQENKKNGVGVGWGPPRTVCNEDE